MISTTSAFLSSTLSVPHNALKHLIFRIAEFFFAVATWKFFALCAARRKSFTSYVVFSEDLVQKMLFIKSRSCSGNGLFILAFTILYSVAKLYGTLLWALDAPGFLPWKHNVTAASISPFMLDNPPYVLQLNVNASNLDSLSKQLPEAVGANLYKPGTNFTLTENVKRGRPSVAAATRRGVGPRIWLDEEGFSVSPDTYVSLKGHPTNASEGFECPWQSAGENGMVWNCTFDNVYALPLLRDTILGRPEVHWDNPSDEKFDSRYITPSRKDNIWWNLGTGGDTTVMTQMFTVTKGADRHTFIETAFKSTMSTVRSKNGTLSEFEVMDMIRQTWSSNTTEQQHPLISMLVRSVMKAQDENHSFMFGSNFGTNYSVAQTHWEFFNVEGRPGEVNYSALQVSVVNITLVRSEKLDRPPVPFEGCETSIQNVAQGGKVERTDCGIRPDFVGPASRFYGQVDTSAVLILTGLGDSSSNVSSKALNQEAYRWALENSDRIDNLVLSRGFIVSIDPSLVTVELSTPGPAISYLQILLVALTPLLCLVSWTLLVAFTSPHWSASLLSNLVATTGSRSAGSGRSNKPGWMENPPSIKLKKTAMGTVMATEEGEFGIVPDELSPRSTLDSVESDEGSGLKAS